MFYKKVYGKSCNYCGTDSNTYSNYDRIFLLCLLLLFLGLIDTSWKHGRVLLAIKAIFNHTLGTAFFFSIVALLRALFYTISTCLSRGKTINFANSINALFALLCFIIPKHSIQGLITNANLVCPRG